MGTFFLNSPHDFLPKWHIYVAIREMFSAAAELITPPSHWFFPEESIRSKAGMGRATTL